MLWRLVVLRAAVFSVGGLFHIWTIKIEGKKNIFTEQVFYYNIKTQLLNNTI